MAKTEYGGNDHSDSSNSFTIFTATLKFFVTYLSNLTAGLQTASIVVLRIIDIPLIVVPILALHVLVRGFAGLESLHTKPTDVDLAGATFHMVAPRNLLDTSTAFGTATDIILLLPLLELFTTLRDQQLVFRAADAFVAWHSALRADGAKAGTAGDDFALFLCECVDVGTVGCRAILVDKWLRADEVIEGAFQETFEVIVLQQRLEILQWCCFPA